MVFLVTSWISWRSTDFFLSITAGLKILNFLVKKISFKAFVNC